VIAQYKDWMRDNWNHPSVVIWDAQNETRHDALSTIIREVRGLDLSNRPWENGYNLPVGPDDPVEDHPYLFGRLGRGFEIADLENMTGAKSTNSAHPTGHAP
jgi:beta-galactosidase